MAVLAVLAATCMAVGSSKALADRVPWTVAVADTRGATVDAQRLRGHVTLVTFSTRETRDRSMRLGQEAGARFGANPAYLSLTLVNVSGLSFLVRPLAGSVIAEAEQEAVDGGLARQRANGNDRVTAEDVRRHVIFVRDADGATWKALGVPPESEALHVGVIDRTAHLTYLAREPIDEAKLFAILEEQLKSRAEGNDNAPAAK